MRRDPNIATFGRILYTNLDFFSLILFQNQRFGISGRIRMSATRRSLLLRLIRFLRFRCLTGHIAGLANL